MIENLSRALGVLIAPTKSGNDVAGDEKNKNKKNRTLFYIENNCETYIYIYIYNIVILSERLS